MEDKLKKAQAQLEFLQKKLEIAKEKKNAVSIGILTAKIAATQKKIARLSKGEQTGAGKMITKIKKKVEEKVMPKKKDSIN